MEKLSTQDVFNKIKAKDKHCISVRDSQKLKNLMYARDILSETEMRYSLFPLNDASDENVESLRALILMLFDMETSNEGVAKAVANIVESEKKETSDSLNFDIQSFLAAHDSLKLEEQKLTDVENKTKEFEALKSNFAQYSELSEIESRFVDFYLQLNSKIKEANRWVNDSAKKIEGFQQQLKPIAKDIKALNQNLFAANKIINTSKQDITKTQKAIEKGHFELNRYANMTQQEVKELLDEELIETKEKIQAYKDTNARHHRIKKLEAEIAQYQLNIQSLKLEISNSEFAIQKQLPSDTLDLLNSINQRLLLANPGKKLEKYEVDAIENFKGLFNDEGYLYNFWGQEFNKLNSRASRDLPKELENTEAELSAAISEKSELEKQDTESPLLIEKKLQELERELNEIERVKKIIFELDDNIGALKVYKRQLADNQATVEELSPKIANLSQMQSELSESIESEKHTLSSLNQKQSQLLGLENSANGTKQAYPKIQKQLEVQSTVNSNTALTLEYLSSLQRDLQQVDHLRGRILEGLRDFARDKFIDLDDDLFNSNPIPSTIHRAYANVKQTYDELEGQWQILKSKTRSHNESVSNYVDILEKNFEHVSRFENQLNRSFEGISVNDLTQIEVSIHVDPRFKNLISEIQKSYNEFSDQALSEQFYLRLQAFSSAFFKEGERNKLVMSDVIKKVSYKVKKDGHDSWQTKQQSTSTTALINLKLVRILLAKLRADSCIVKLPVIMDEAANINVDQYEWLLRDIMDSGFYLFTAGTHSSGAELVHMIGNHYDVDALKTAKPYTAERTRVVWDGPQSFYDEESFESFVENDQMKLLEGVNETI